MGHKANNRPDPPLQIPTLGKRQTQTDVPGYGVRVQRELLLHGELKHEEEGLVSCCRTISTKVPTEISPAQRSAAALDGSPSC